MLLNPIVKNNLQLNFYGLGLEEERSRDEHQGLIQKFIFLEKYAQNLETYLEKLCFPKVVC